MSAKGARRERPPRPDVPAVDGIAEVESLDHEGRGVAHVDGKVVFVEGGLMGERVAYSSRRRKPSFEIAEVVEVLRESAMRVDPRCPHFGHCGGCSMQHLDATAQVAVKQRVLEDNFRHIGKLRPEVMLPPIHGPAWKYRYRARLSVRLVEKKGGVLVGFHEKRSSYVADMRECHVLPAHVSDLLVPLRALVGSLSIARRLPQIELAIGERDDGRGLVTVLVLRHLEPLTQADEVALSRFAAEHPVSLWLQPKGPDSIHALAGQEAFELSYALPEFDVRFRFRATDFTQVNAGINRVLVSRAVRLLALEPDDRVADLFCGLGNFTLPIARRAREVVGLEGSRELVERARYNAGRHGLDDRVRFDVANLFEVDADGLAALGRFDKFLIDPPRDGAVAIAKALAAIRDAGPRRIVYVSCNPSTLARDAAVLVHEGGYRLDAAGIVNMFPQTSHVESIAVFTRG